jgi:cytochrome P450
MKIIAEQCHYPRDQLLDASISVSDAVERALDGSDYGRGDLETLKASIDNNAKAIAWLVQTLHDNSALHDTDIKELLKSVLYINARIEE